MKSEILDLITKNIFHGRETWMWEDDDTEGGDPDVTKHLIRAYIAVSNLDDCDKEIPTLSGSDADVYVMQQYLECFPDKEKNYWQESYSWPEELPYEEQIPKSILKMMAKRMAKYDLKTQEGLRKYAVEQNKIKTANV